MRFAAFAVVFLILPGLRAQEDYAPPTPTDEAKSLQRLVGEWQGEGVSRQGPGADPVPWTAQCKTTSLFGGFFVREELEVQLGMPSTMRMTTLYGHDRSHDSLVQFNMGNTGGMMRSELRWVDADTLVAFASARFQGQLHVGRAIWRFDGDSYTYRHERATDTGDWFVEIDGKFTRVDAAKVNMKAGAFMEMPAPAEMGALDALCGDWRLAGEMKMVGVPDMEVSGHETVQSIYGGHLVESVAKSDPMPDGGVWEGLSWFAWDADHGHYWSLMTDSMGEFTCTPMWHYSDDAFVSVDARMMDGQPSTNRIVIHLQGDRMTGFESHTVAGTDAPFRSFKATYTQVVPDAGATEVSEPLRRVELEACAPSGDQSLRWSPKGATLALRDVGAGVLETVLELGGESPRAVRLERSPGSEHQDRLLIDLDGDGEFGADEELGCTPSERRGKWWSSFAATVKLSVPPATANGEPGQRAYPINLWYVFDPVEPEAAPALRFSRRGWHQGQVEVDGAPVVVQINDYVMDGTFTRGDAWRIGRDVADVLAPPVRTLERHDWLDSQAWRVVELDPHGRFVTITRFDPGVSDAEERAAEDRYAADRRAPRAPQPLAFRHDVDAALVAAQTSGSHVLLDFETSWCGPCKQMDQMVYTAQAVVDAAQGMVCIKVDGDARRDLVQRFGVRGYPTLVVLGADGAELRRAVGYQSVAATATLLRRDDG